MAGFQKHKAELDAAGVAVAAASVDPLDKAQEVAAEVGFPVGYGVTRAAADALGAFWEERRQIIQPSQFVLGPGDKIVACTYSDGPLGRIDAGDVVKLVAFLESRS